MIHSHTPILSYIPPILVVELADYSSKSYQTSTMSDCSQSYIWAIYQRENRTNINHPSVYEALDNTCHLNDGVTKAIKSPMNVLALQT